MSVCVFLVMSVRICANTIIQKRKKPNEMIFKICNKNVDRLTIHKPEVCLSVRYTVRNIYPYSACDIQWQTDCAIYWYLRFRYGSEGREIFSRQLHPNPTVSASKRQDRTTTTRTFGPSRFYEHILHVYLVDLWQRRKSEEGHSRLISWPEYSNVAL